MLAVKYGLCTVKHMNNKTKTQYLCYMLAVTKSGGLCIGIIHKSYLKKTKLQYKKPQNIGNKT